MKANKSSHQVDEPMPSLCVEGWRDLNHSYALVNQWQLLHLIQKPFRICHRDVKPYNPNWNRQQNGSGFAKVKRERVLGIPRPDKDEAFSVIYRIAAPFNLADGPAERIFIFVATEYGVMENHFTGGRIEEACKRDNLEFITPSQWCKQGFVRAGVPESKIHIISHGVEPSDFFPVEPELRLIYRQLLGIQPDDVALLNLGALTPNKGVDLLLKAYAALKPQHPNLKLVLKDQSNLYNRTIESVLEEMAASGHMMSLPEEEMADVIRISDNLDIESLRALYNACDFYVSPYRAEGFNLPPLEAAACGLPILVTAGGSTDDYFSPAIGMTIPSTLKTEGSMHFLEPDFDALVNGIECVLDRSLTWGETSGSKLVRKLYSWASITDKLVDCFGLA